jgi:hypothetical protein
MTYENVIIMGIINYWVLSIVVVLARIYSIKQKFIKWKSEGRNKMTVEFINHYKKLIFTDTFKKMNVYSKINVVLFLIPIAILTLLAPPLILPFEIIGFFVTIPNKIKARRKKKMDEALKVSYKLFDDAILQMNNDFFKDDLKDVFKKKDEYTAVISEHHSAGMFLRNGLALWDTSRDLTRFFIHGA